MIDPQALTERVMQGDFRSIAHFISAIERGIPDLQPQLAVLFKASRTPRVIGVTGPPGAGKSTLVNELLRLWRRQGKRVAVLAIDPSSPTGGGSVLGDRVRMQVHAEDRGVFVRSMSARGAYGGLARAAADALTVLEAAPFDLIVIETVGVGQSEVDIASYAPCVLLLQTPAVGDMVQAIKSGIIEIGTIMVVTKPSLGNAERTARHLREAAGGAGKELADWTAPVIVVDALERTGLDALLESIETRFDYLAFNPQTAADEEAKRLIARATALARGQIEARLARIQFSHEEFADLLSQVQKRRATPMDLAERMLGA